MQTVLITGVTSGLGLELAKLYQNHKLILIGRKEKPQSELFQSTLYIQADLSQLDNVLKILKTLEREGVQHLDLLIHNAALGYYGNVAKQGNKNIDELLQVNLYTPIALTKALLNHLQPKGKVVFINSIAANLSAPDYAVYAASKAALSGFARNLKIESALPVQTIYPGAIQTTFHDKSGVPQGRFDISRFPSAKNVASKVYRAIQSGKSEVTIGFMNKVTRAAAYYFPNLFDSFVKSKT